MFLKIWQCLYRTPPVAASDIKLMFLLLMWNIYLFIPDKKKKIEFFYNFYKYNSYKSKNNNITLLKITRIFVRLYLLIYWRDTERSISMLFYYKKMKHSTRWRQTPLFLCLRYIIVKIFFFTNCRGNPGDKHIDLSKGQSVSHFHNYKQKLLH